MKATPRCARPSRCCSTSFAAARCGCRAAGMRVSAAAACRQLGSPLQGAARGGRRRAPCPCRPPACFCLCPQVESINLKGLDRVIFVTQHPQSKQLLLRQYSVALKKSGAPWAASPGADSERPGDAAVGNFHAPAAACGSPHTCRSPAAFLHTGTRVPRTELTEMGPALDLELRRSRQPPVDLEKEACRRPKLDKKKASFLCVYLHWSGCWWDA